MAKQGSDMCTSGVTQRIALGALESGLIERLQPVDRRASTANAATRSAPL